MKHRLIILMILPFMLLSCNDWLDVDLVDRVTEDKLFSTELGYSEALAGVYSKMASGSLYGQTLTMENMDLLAQYYDYNSVAANYEKMKLYDYEDAGLQNRFQSIWRNMYTAISGANNIIRWAEKDVDVLSPEMKNQVLGEAIALRAFLHLDLIRMFCPDVKRDPKEMGIPYNKEFGVSLPPQYTVEECVQLVYNDLKEAEMYLQDDPITEVIPYEMGSKNDADKLVARMNLYSVKALLARVSLMRGDKLNAIAYATEVIESGKFRLLNFESVDKPSSTIDMLFSDEHIFSLRNKSLSEYTIQLHYPEVTETSTRFAYLPFGSVGTIYENNNDDVRNIKWFNAATGNFAKYNTDSDVFFPKMPMVKLSEMYLILAESYLSTDFDVALGYFNTLRDHRVRNNAAWSYLNIDFIVQEMKREFLGEGQLWFAYKRLNMGVPTNDAIVGIVPPSNTIFVFPIPLKEIESGNRSSNN